MHPGLPSCPSQYSDAKGCGTVSFGEGVVEEGVVGSVAQEPTELFQSQLGCLQLL